MVNEVIDILALALNEATPFDNSQKQGLIVADEKDATYFSGLLAMWQNEIERRKEQCREYVAHAERTLERLQYLCSNQLEDWTAKELTTVKGKSIKLASATIGFRTQKDKLVITDKDTYIKWCDDNKVAGYVVETRTIITPANEYYEKEGKVPDGVNVEKGFEKFYVK